MNIGILFWLEISIFVDFLTLYIYNIPRISIDCMSCTTLFVETQIKKSYT